MVRRGTGSWVGGATGEWAELPKDSQYPCTGEERGGRKERRRLLLPVGRRRHPDLMFGEDERLGSQFDLSNLRIWLSVKWEEPLQ